MIFIIIVVIDSGVSDSYQCSRVIGGIHILDEYNGEFAIDENINDVIGHGTDVIDIIVQKCPDAQIYVVRIFDEKYTVPVSKFCFALEYIHDNLACDIIQLSIGTVEYSKELYEIVKKLARKSVIILSAFDNEGAVSYPAAFEEVIGVDVDDTRLKHSNYFVADGGIVDIRVDKSYYRVNTPRKVVTGSSFALSYICAETAMEMESDPSNKTKAKLLDALKTKKGRYYSVYEFEKRIPAKEFLREVKSVAVFPFNKEIHALARFEDLTEFDLTYYDTRSSGNCKLRISQALTACCNEKVINNIDSLDWESDFDMLLLGYCNDLSELENKNYTDEFISKCLKYNKKLFSFEDISGSLKDIPSQHRAKFFFPCADISDISQNTFGKLRYISKPVVGIYGTSSKQGKYTLQLLLRRKFLNEGYKLAQLGSEPSGSLFGFNEVFPMGFHSTVKTSGSASVNILNNMMFRMEQDDPDIIITGSQSGTIPYSKKNLNYIPFFQTDFILGTLPDAVILCVNTYDDIEYIKRTIKYIEAFIKTKVIAIAVSFRQNKFKQAANVNDFSNILSDISGFENEFGLRIFSYESTGFIDELFNEIINYFKGG